MRLRNLFLAFTLFLTTGGIPYCSGWTSHRVPSPRPCFNEQGSGSSWSALRAQHDDPIVYCSQYSEASKRTRRHEHLTSFFSGSIATVSLTAALLLGSPIAQASDDTEAPEVSSDVSTNVVVPSKNEGLTPPEIKSKSSAKALAISKKMKDLNTRFYGAYWCGHCADQKEALGREAFEKNIEYVECSENGKNSQANALCEEKDIKGYPTWEINSIKYPGERSLDELEKMVQMAQASSPDHPKKAPTISASSSGRAKAISSQLSALDAKLYGAYWCPHTFDQKEALGKEAFEPIPYIECAKDGENSQMSVCKDNKVRVVPTWEINGKLYEGERSLDELQKIIKSQPPQETPAVAPNADGAVSPKKQEFPSEGSVSTEKKTSEGEPAEDGMLAKKSEDKGSEDSSKEKPSAKDSKNEEKADDAVNALAKNSEEKSSEEPSKDKVKPPEEITIATNPKESPNTGALKEEKTAENAPALTKNEEEKGSEDTSKVKSSGDASLLATKSDEEIAKDDKSTEDSSALAKKPLPEKKDDTKEPPAILASSNNRALALADQMEKVPTTMYGAYWCSHCANQKEDLGKEAFSKIQYVECTKDGKDSQIALCKEKGVKSVPTWEVNGKMYSGKRDIEELENIVSSELKVLTASTGETPDGKAGNKESDGKSPPEVESKSSNRALSLASKLEDADTRLYGAYWCGFTQAQKEQLGKEAISKIRYVECSQDGENSEIDLCRSKKIIGYPTWEINNNFYPGEQDLEELEEILKENKS